MTLFGSLGRLPESNVFALCVCFACTPLSLHRTALTQHVTNGAALMHSESVAIHQEALRLFAQSGLENNLDFERRHLAILDRFGRYPHRNAILGRESTPEEIEFLQQPGAGF